MKNTIVEFFKHDRTYKEAVKLIHKYSNKVSLKRQVNVQEETPHMRGIVFEELRELGQISHSDYQSLMANKVVPKPVPAKPADLEMSPEDDLIKNFGELSKTDPELIELMKRILELEEAKETESEEYKELKERGDSRLKELMIQAQVKTIPTAYLGAVKLRQEFPFLKETDCPNELKILVADKMTAFENYKKAHEDLFSAESEEEFAKASGDTVENFINNREIFDELNYYKENGKILGKHPIFQQNDRMAEIRNYPIPDLVKLKTQLENNLVRNKKKVKDEPKHPKMAERKTRIKEQEAELKEVKKLLNIDKK